MKEILKCQRELWVLEAAKKEVKNDIFLSERRRERVIANLDAQRQDVAMTVRTYNNALMSQTTDLDDYIF